VKRTSAHGTTYSQGSEHKWADWQVPPVICAACKKRVTLAQGFMGSFLHGTFHLECLNQGRRP